MSEYATTSAIGVDFSSFWLDVCRVDRDSDQRVIRVRWARQPLRRARGDAEEIAITNVRNALVSCIASLSLDLRPPVFIERGFGASRRSDFLLGCIYGACVAGAASIGCAWYSMPRQEWAKQVSGDYGIVTKKGEPGNANASKADLHVACRALLLPLGMDLENVGPDALDAFGVAYTGGLR